MSIKSILLGSVFLLILHLTSGEIIVLKRWRRLKEFHSMELPFSNHEDDEIEGVVLLANPLHGCSPISKPVQNDPTLNWFVLVAGNVCDYSTKVYHAESAGYKAAIIYNLKDWRSDAFHRHHRGYLPNITAVVVGTDAGIIIKERYLYTIDERCRLLIYPTIFDTISFLSIMVVAFAGLIVIIMIAYLLSRYVQRSHDADENSILNVNNLEQLQTSKFKAGDPYETCAICLEDFKNDEKLRILPCCHGYHAACIDQWLTESSRSCPICKKQVRLKQESQLETAPLLRTASSERSYRTLSNSYQGRLHIMPFNVQQLATSQNT